MNPSTAFPWPEGFERVPQEEWRHRPIDELAIRYDAVEQQGWYRNLEPTLDQLGAFLREGDVVLDYSAGTGILARRLLRGDISCAVLLVDASPKFLRLALERLGNDPRAAFRLIRYLEPERRLQLVQEVTQAEVLTPGVDALVSTNAIHLYYDLEITLNSWSAALKPGGLAFVQSGNVRNPQAGRDHWIIDDTVEAIHRAAMEIVREDPRYAAYRGHPDDAARQRKYDQLRAKFFLPPRDLPYYTEALEKSGFEIQTVDYVPFEVQVQEWYEFLSTYHEGVLGWIGGSARIDGNDPTEQAVTDRLRLIREGLDRVFDGAATFLAGWTYIRCSNNRADAKQ